MNIADYFRAQLGEPMRAESASLAQIGMDSAIGQKCQAAIDRAREKMDQLIAIDAPGLAKICPLLADEIIIQFIRGSK
jgi:hypothetical protein